MMISRGVFLLIAIHLVVCPLSSCWCGETSFVRGFTTTHRRRRGVSTITTTTELGSATVAGDFGYPSKNSRGGGGDDDGDDSSSSFTVGGVGVGVQKKMGLLKRIDSFGLSLKPKALAIKEKLRLTSNRGQARQRRRGGRSYSSSSSSSSQAMMMRMMTTTTTTQDGGNVGVGGGVGVDDGRASPLDATTKRTTAHVSKLRRYRWMAQASTLFALFMAYRAYRGFFVILPAVFRETYRKLDQSLDSPYGDDDDIDDDDDEFDEGVEEMNIDDVDDISSRSTSTGIIRIDDIDSIDDIDDKVVDIRSRTGGTTTVSTTTTTTSSSGSSSAMMTSSGGTEDTTKTGGIAGGGGGRVRLRTALTISVLSSIVLVSYVITGALRVLRRFLRTIFSTNSIPSSFEAAADEVLTNEDKMIRYSLQNNNDDNAAAAVVNGGFRPRRSRRSRRRRRRRRDSTQYDHEDHDHDIGGSGTVLTDRNGNPLLP